MMLFLRRVVRVLPFVAMVAASTALADMWPNKHSTGVGSIDVAFTPGDRIDRLVIGEIDAARSEVIVHAYSFTDRSIARDHDHGQLQFHDRRAAQQRGQRHRLAR